MPNALCHHAVRAAVAVGRRDCQAVGRRVRVGRNRRPKCPRRRWRRGRRTWRPPPAGPGGRATIGPSKSHCNRPAASTPAVLETIDLFEPQLSTVEETQDVPSAGGSDVHRQIRLLGHLLASEFFLLEDRSRARNTRTTNRYRVSKGGGGECLRGKCGGSADQFNGLQKRYDSAAIPVGQRRATASPAKAPAHSSGGAAAEPIRLLSPAQSPIWT